MPDYSQCKTYVIKFYDDDKLIYIGSTTQSLQKRLCSHKKDFKCSLYKYIFDNYNGDFKCCFIELHQNQSCNDKTELDKIEGELIKQFKADDNFNVINKNIAGRTPKQRYIDNIDRIKQYYQNNADIKRKYQNEYNIKKRNYKNQINQSLSLTA
jgi:hypothetical protein